MKLPLYIEEEQRKRIALLLTQVGRKYSALLKKIILVASYGTMLVGKIEFSEFLYQISSKIINDGRLDEFWGFKYKATCTQDKFFGIPYKIVYYENLNTVENEIIKLFYGNVNETSFTNKMIPTRTHIKPKFQMDVKQMFQKL